MDPITGMIAASIISGIINAGVSYFGGEAQKKELAKGQAEARELNKQQLKQDKLTSDRNYAFGREQLGEQKRQFDTSRYDAKEQTGYNRFTDQATRVGNLLNQNESLKNTFISRIAGLRG
jgi:hypothetical protein